MHEVDILGHDDGIGLSGGGKNRLIFGVTQAKVPHSDCRN
jgi:hypothetical protein